MLRGARRDPWETPPGANREGTRGRLPTAMVRSSYGPGAAATNVDERSCRRCVGHNGGVFRPSSSVRAAAAPAPVIEPEADTDTREDRPWVVIVWNDPVNLMSYVTWVLQKLFGYSLERATQLMLDVHHKGKAVVASGTREQAEMHVFRLHEHGLWASMEHDS